MAHALLSASSASRWLACTPSARLTEHIQDDKRKPHAEEGTLAHELAELCLKYNLNEITKSKYNAELKKIQKHELYTADMQDYVGDFVIHCHSIYLEAKKESTDVIMQLETKVDFSQYVPEGFGTCDVLIARNGTVDIIDLKYGKGVEVSAEDNSQLKLYALGALNEFEFLFDIETINMTIYQPRKNNISIFSMTTSDLLQWAEEELKTKALLAYDGAGEQVSGDHCMFCKLKPTCRKLAEDKLKLLKYENKQVPTLTNEEISDILKIGKDLNNWVKNVEAYALKEALKGNTVKGFKVVEGRSDRVYTDEEAIRCKLVSEGYGVEGICPSKLLRVGAMEKLLGKKKFNKLIGDLVIKPQGTPTLAPITDRREEFNSISSARADFANVEL